eukprot:TRINITY_DN41947_c0_g1_i1.p1 TRINITY_DN41947_c0_g1~~TRINITY_DN41947_c0_g1_i1.p1  ORF type:complete len:418 (-),score=51.79 TRINITY_DN41947_c0_g1_i1:283-1536(-)
MHLAFPGGVFGSSAFAVLQAASMAFIGITFARTGVIDTVTKKVLSTISMKIAIPCLLFSNLLKCPQGGPQQDPALCPAFASILRTTFPFLLFPFIWVLLGLAIGCLVVRLTSAPARLRGVILSSCAFGNSTGLPIVLFSVISSSRMSRMNPLLQERQYLIMLAVYQMTYPVLQWGLGRALLSGSAPSAKAQEHDNENSDLENRLYEEMDSSDPNEQARDGTKGGRWRCRDKVKDVAGAIFTPPVIATVAAAILGAVPEVRGFLVDVNDYDDDAVLGWAFNAIELFGKAAVPLNMMVLGAGLSQMPNFVSIHWPSTVAVSVAKLVIIPGVTCSFVAAMRDAGILAWMQPDKELQRSLIMVACLVTATPTANNLVVMAELWGESAAREALAGMIFLMYCMVPFLLTAWITVFNHLGSVI